MVYISLQIQKPLKNVLYKKNLVPELEREQFSSTSILKDKDLHNNVSIYVDLISFSSSDRTA